MPGLEDRSEPDVVGVSGLVHLRRFYWRHIRRWESEICEVCGRPVRVAWWCHDPKLWTRVTGYSRVGREDAAGIWCIYCFDAATRFMPWLEWAPINLRHLGIGAGEEMEAAEAALKESYHARNRAYAKLNDKAMAYCEALERIKRDQWKLDTEQIEAIIDAALEDRSEDA